MNRAFTLTAFAMCLGLGAFLRFSPPGTVKSELVRSIGRVRPNAAAAANQRRGYYEDLAGARGAPDFSWGQPPIDYLTCFKGGPTSAGPVFEPVTTDWRNRRYKKNVDTTCFGGVPFRTNQYGYRGPDWAKTPAPGTVRVAVMGASHVNGFGVRVEETFPSVLAETLNASSKEARYELLNFSVMSYSPLDQLALIDDVLALSPQVILLVSQVDIALTERRLLSRSKAYELGPAKTALLPPSLRALRKQFEEAVAAEAKNSGQDPEIVHGLTKQIVMETYRLIAERARSSNRNVVLVRMELPDIGMGGGIRDASMSEETPQNRAILDAGARAAGFHVLETYDVFADYDPMELWVHDWDSHTNPAGHRIIARRLAKDLPPLLPTAPPPAPPTP